MNFFLILITASILGCQKKEPDLKLNESNEKNVTVKLSSEFIETEQIPSSEVISNDDFETKLMKFPGTSPESIQWNVRPVDWKYSDGYTFKGKVFVIKTRVDRNEAVDPHVYPVKYNTVTFELKTPLDIFPTKELKGQPIFQIKDGLFKDNVKICYKDNSKFSIGLLSFPDNKECTYKLNYSLWDGGYAHTFKFSQLNLKESWLEILIHDENYYLDISVCKTTPLLCKIEDRKYNQLEIDWVNLVKNRIQQNSLMLDYFIEKLKPCLKEKNKNCIDTYIVDELEAKKSETGEGEPLPYRSLPYEKILEELSECLDYDKLLPHLKATRGKDYICIFNDGSNTISVGLPSDLDISSPIEYKCEKNEDCMKIYNNSK